MRGKLWRLRLFFYFYNIIKSTMGKGDKRSKRGKIHIGTYGVKRKRKKAAKKSAKGAAKKAATKKAAKKAAK
ncbi:MAG: 30S ribosomal protein THX [Bacteroidia bacterium]